MRTEHLLKYYWDPKEWPARNFWYVGRAAFKERIVLFAKLLEKRFSETMADDPRKWCNVKKIMRIL